jgi:hypothetical protein
MAIENGPSIVTSGLILCLDAADRNSYVSGSTTWYDVSGNGNNATINTAYHVYTAGLYFNISTDGSASQAITISNFRSNLINAHTLECFIYPINGQPAMLSGQCGGSDCWSYGESGNYYDRTGATNIGTGYSTNVWQQLVVTFNGTSTATSYKNASQVSTTNSFSMASLTQGTAYIAARIWAATASQYRLGIMRFYNRALSATEIAQNYNSIKTRFGL